MSNIETLSEAKPVNMADEWFEIATPEHFWMQWRHAVLLRAVKASGILPATALEIGCGSGVARMMLERDLHLPVDGCDLNRAALEMAPPGQGRLLSYDILELEPTLLGQYDAVFLLDVLEHIPDDTQFLSAALEHLRPGGLIVVNVPASMLFFSEYDRVAGHVQRYTHRSLTELFQKCGVESGAIEYWGFSMIPALLARTIYLKVMTPADVVRTGFEPPNSFIQSFFLALKNIETSLPFAMPFGTSLLAWGQRSHRDA
ncbi:MAG: class I SAM-dependent methyltransferase [Chthoniobacterales bacterium]